MLLAPQRVLKLMVGKCALVYIDQVLLFVVTHGRQVATRSLSLFDPCWNLG
jgi:hypothetical protein